MSTTAYIYEICTAVPENSYSQEFALEFLSSLSSFDEEDRRFLRRIYKDTGIENRHTVINDYGKTPSEYQFYPPTADLKPEPTIEKRNNVYITEANRLSLMAADGLFRKLDGIDPPTVTHLITVSCTGFSAPGFSDHLVRQLGLNPEVQRYHLGFMGCYAAIPALRLADTICRADSEARVLVVALELCSLHFEQKADRESMVAYSLFADGVAACLICGRPRVSPAPLLELKGFLSRVLDNTETQMAWTIGESAFKMKLSAGVPKEIEKHIGPIIESLSAKAGMGNTDFDLWAIHPGGRAILDRVAAALKLPKEKLGASYEVLRQYGNMSSATVLFVLEKLLRGPDAGQVFAAAFGPGLTVETACLEKLWV